MKKVLKKLVPISLVLGFVQNLISWHYVKDVAASEIAWLADANPGGFLNQNLSVIIRGVVGTGIGWLILIFIVVYIFKGFKKYFKNKTTKSVVPVNNTNYKLDKNIFSKRNYFIIIISFLILFLLSFTSKHSWYFSVVDLRLTLRDMLIFFAIIIFHFIYNLKSILYNSKKKLDISKEFYFLFINISIVLFFAVINTTYYGWINKEIIDLNKIEDKIKTNNGSQASKIMFEGEFFLSENPAYKDKFLKENSLKKSEPVTFYTFVINEDYRFRVIDNLYGYNTYSLEEVAEAAFDAGISTRSYIKKYNLIDISEVPNKLLDVSLKIFTLPKMFKKDLLTQISYNKGLTTQEVLKYYKQKTYYKVDLKNYAESALIRVKKEDEFRSLAWFSLASRPFYNWFIIVFTSAYFFRLLAYFTLTFLSNKSLSFVFPSLKIGLEYLSNRKKNTLLFVLLVLINKVLIHFLMYPIIINGNTYSLGKHINLIFDSEVWLFVPAFLSLVFIAWYFNDSIKAK